MDYSALRASPLRGRPPGVITCRGGGLLATSSRDETDAAPRTLRALSLSVVTQIQSRLGPTRLVYRRNLAEREGFEPSKGF